MRLDKHKYEIIYWGKKLYSSQDTHMLSKCKKLSTGLDFGSVQYEYEDQQLFFKRYML